MFNIIIESLDLREIDLTGRQFTCANTLPIPTYEKLDRVLASVEWEQKFPLVTVGKKADCHFDGKYSKNSLK